MPLPEHLGCPCRNVMSRAPTQSKWDRPDPWAAQRGPIEAPKSPRAEPLTTKQLPIREGAGAETTPAALEITGMRIGITTADGDTAIGAAARIPAAIGT